MFTARQLARSGPSDIRPFVVIATVGVVGFAILGVIVAVSARIPREALVVRDLHNATSSGAMDEIMKATTFLGGPGILFPFAVLVAVLLAFRQRLDRAVFLVGGLGGAYVLEWLTKRAFHRMRPDLFPKLARESDYSFPSGHATGSMALMTAICLIAWRSRYRWPVTSAAAVFVLAVGFSRIYLGVHYLSDVLAGWCLALAWVATFATVALPTTGSQPASCD